MPSERSEALARLVASIEGINEAHLPQCFVIGLMKSPAQVLAVVIDPNADERAVVEAIGRGLAGIVPEGEHLDVWPVRPASSVYRDIRGRGCAIYEASRKRPWWKFW